MRLKIFLIGHLLVLMLTATLCSAHTWLVPSEHPLICGAVDSASYGDTVLVEPGTYYRERAIEVGIGPIVWIVMKDGVMLMSESGAEVTELVEPSPSVLSAIIRCDSVSDATIKGFTIRAEDTMWEVGTAIEMISCKMIVEDNIIHGPHYGIAVFREPPRPDRPIIRGNEIYDCYEGIYAWEVWESDSPWIDNNHIRFCAGHGIWSQNSDPYITGNAIEYNWLGGIRFEGWSQSLLVKNKIANNYGNGVTAVMDYAYAHPSLNHTGQKEMANDVYGNGGYDVYYEEGTGLGTFGATLSYWGQLIPIPTLYGNVDIVPWVDSTHTLVCYDADDCDPAVSPTRWGTIKSMFR